MRIWIIGLGDLGLRIATLLASEAQVSELLLVGRGHGNIRARASLAECCGSVRVRAAEFDALETARMAEAIDAGPPDLIVQCASLLSPWALRARGDHAAAAICRAGFAAQLPAQLPVLMSVMRAVRSSARRIPVVNASYPDATHPMLVPLGLSPLVGVGNVGMIAARAQAALRARGRAGLMRVVAHHAHVTAALGADAAAFGASPPRVYVGEEGERADELACSGVRLEPSRDWNALTAVHAVSIIRALLFEGEPLRTCAPGPNGLAGGYPVRVGRGHVELDLPRHLAAKEAAALHLDSARLDGIDHLDANGTVTFTAEARSALDAIDPELGRPLHPDDSLARWDTMKRCLAIPEKR